MRVLQGFYTLRTLIACLLTVEPISITNGLKQHCYFSANGFSGFVARHEGSPSKFQPLRHVLPLAIYRPMMRGQNSRKCLLTSDVWHKKSPKAVPLAPEVLSYACWLLEVLLYAIVVLIAFSGQN